MTPWQRGDEGLRFMFGNGPARRRASLSCLQRKGDRLAPEVAGRSALENVDRVITNDLEWRQSMSLSFCVRFAMGLVASAVAMVAAASSAFARDDEITVTILQVHALDKADAFLSDDLYARVTIAGEVFKTPRVAQSNDIIPNWKISKVVPRGDHDVKVEIFDKDVFSPDDKIDINRLPNKRDLDFIVDTRRCRIDGFANRYRCNQQIRRAGDERKKAEIVFYVTVR